MWLTLDFFIEVFVWMANRKEIDFQPKKKIMMWSYWWAHFRPKVRIARKSLADYVLHISSIVYCGKQFGYELCCSQVLKGSVWPNQSRASTGSCYPSFVSICVTVVHFLCRQIPKQQATPRWEGPHIIFRQHVDDQDSGNGFFYANCLIWQDFTLCSVLNDLKSMCKRWLSNNIASSFLTGAFFLPNACNTAIRRRTERRRSTKLQHNTRLDYFDQGYSVPHHL